MPVLVCVGECRLAILVLALRADVKIELARDARLEEAII